MFYFWAWSNVSWNILPLEAECLNWDLLFDFLAFFWCFDLYFRKRWRLCLRLDLFLDFWTFEESEADGEGDESEDRDDEELNDDDDEVEDEDDDEREDNFFRFLGFLKLNSEMY